MEAQPNAPFDLLWLGWLPNYLDPSGMLNALLADSEWGPPFLDPVYQRRLAAADKLSGPERYLTYTTLDLDLARNAARSRRSTTCRPETSSRPGSGAKHLGSTVWT